jgi:DNA-binding response OmpR family regulator
MQYRILVVDNDLRSRKNVCQLLREEGYDVDQADDGHTALARLEAAQFDLLICDVVMPRLNAFDVINEMRSRALSMPVILITGHPEALAATALRNLPYFTKPFNLYDLLHKTRQLLGEEVVKPKPA